jgi:dATP pyrophosphohydrolase
MRFKIPQSVLVVIHTPQLDVLLIERADQHGHATGLWQSVTGSKDTEDEPYVWTAMREVMEETGIDIGARGLEIKDWQQENQYEMNPRWLHRYAPGVRRNTERVFGLCTPACFEPRLNPREHVAWVWLPWHLAADRCFSASNAEAVLMLPRMAAQ